MARRSAALIGPGCGPKVHLGGNHGSVQLCGTQDGEHVVLRRFLEDGTEEEHVFESAGRHPFLACHAASVQYMGGNRHFSAIIFVGS